MRVAAVALLALIAATCTALAQEDQGIQASLGLDRDPLRRELPRADLFMPMTGGVYAISGEPAEVEEAFDFEAERQRRDGGIIVGYCLKSSCTRVTHLAVLQVCGSRIGGSVGADSLVLGIVRLPYGRTPGYVKSLQGRDYAQNFAANGPYEQILAANDTDKVGSLYSMTAVGAGPVAPLEFQGLEIAPRQPRETLALQLVRTRDLELGLQNARFEVRHLCRKHLS